MVQKTPEDPTSHKFYMFISMFWVSSMVTSKIALQWISYSTKLVVKCKFTFNFFLSILNLKNIFTAAKPIPIMILSVIFIGRSYTAQKCAVVLAIVIGVGIFSYKDSSSANSKEFSYIGNGLLFTSVLSDGLMCLVQDKMRISAKPSSLHFMCYVNAWSSAFLITLMSVTGEGRNFLEFCQRHPQIIIPMLGCISAGVAGQFFISLMLINFGSLALSLVTTTRKFFSVLVSALVFGNSLILRQWCASGLILTALLLDSYFTKSKIEEKDEKNDESVDEYRHFEVIELQTHDKIDMIGK